MAAGTLARSRTHKILAGVCGGIADYTGWDVGVIRLITAIAACFTIGTVLFIYIVLWVVLPEEGSATTGLDSIVGAFSSKKDSGETDLR